MRSYLSRTSRNTLIELPLAWYAEKGGYWAMNPGYDRPDHRDLGRLIGYECMFCHNGYPQVPAGNADGDPAFSSVPEGIDCQRCHGPGAKHVRLARDRTARTGDVRAAIVNPARLTKERQMEVCMQCHLETTSFSLPHSLVRYERGPFSYRPGEPLADFMLHFDEAPGSGQDDRFEIAGAAYRLRRSECFQKSEGALQCTTCHNPHEVLRPEEAARHYTTVCRQCHGASSIGWSARQTLVHPTTARAPLGHVASTQSADLACLPSATSRSKAAWWHCRQTLAYWCAAASSTGTSCGLWQVVQGSVPPSSESTPTAAGGKPRRDFELIVTALPRRMIEDQHEFRQRLTRLVGECAPFVRGMEFGSGGWWFPGGTACTPPSAVRR